MAPSIPSDPGQEQVQNQFFRALSHHRRRSVLRLLREHRKLHLPALAEKIARKENDGAIDEIPAHNIRAVSIDLYHCHIPILVEADLVDHAEEGDIVTISDRGVTGFACVEEATE